MRTGDGQPAMGDVPFDPEPEALNDRSGRRIIHMNGRDDLI